jgi:hypothetical protein
MSLAKHPASTIQILGAEKALFRALKKKHDTPKYGLIYHAQLISQSSPKVKGKVSLSVLKCDQEVVLMTLYSVDVPYGCGESFLVCSC